jgi:predicted dehydrogenase
MKTIKWGIVGCGDVTELKSGPAFNKVPDSKLVAVMRRDAAKAEDYARRHGVPRWYSNADELINDPEVNAVYIATPPLQHEEYALAAMKAGKPVYVEKPMTVDAAAAQRIVDAIKEDDKVSVAHYRRAQPVFLKVKGLIDNKAVGDIRLIDLVFLQPSMSQEELQNPRRKWRVEPTISGGGLFHDLAPHQLDLMLYFFGKPAQVKGIAANQQKIYAADDIVTGQVKFESGPIFSGSWSFNVADSKDSCIIYGSEGSLSFAVFGKPEIIMNRKGNIETFTFDPLRHVQQPMIERVVKYFLGKEENLCSAQDGLEVMKMIDAITGR